MAFYKSDNNTVDLFTSELFKNGNFTVTGTIGAGLLEKVSLEKTEASAGDTVKISVKLRDTTVVGYIDAWYTEPLTNNDIHVNLSYNSETGLYEGTFPIRTISESGDYHLSRMAFYGGGNIVDLQQAELFQSGNFTVSGTNGGGFIDSLTVSKKEAGAGDIVKFGIKVNDSAGINYILLWYTSPITYKTIYVYLYYNSESGMFEANLPIDSSYELGDYNTNRLTIYASGVTYDYLDYDNKLMNGKFSVIKDITAPVKPIVNKVTDNDIYVNGTTEANAQVEVKVGTSIVGSGVANASGTFRIEIPKQKSGTKVTINAKDLAGNTSTAQVVISTYFRSVKIQLNGVDFNSGYFGNSTTYVHWSALKSLRFLTRI
ncbi:hypothetical protein FB550_1056 [Neobacillus bataviensis]|uniref:Bacterial Ig domain-containing protein n=1 Tax=Neobacillus bataviensis TaxID=220685 RepID=A0A561DE51_9BACI|nr:Ig-like domain-containing protein [Neobacillus bataviensis]TWE01641.1 hypothetical protein FB550_1056 [Neobacillus bataviensis]